jgi:hypothetical protein
MEIQQQAGQHTAKKDKRFMGMDVIGLKPDSEGGECFCRNVWRWHPLWDYCTFVAIVARTVTYGHSNDGDGLDKEDALLLASILRGELESGRTAEAEKERETALRAMPDETCQICNGTGKRKPVPHLGAEELPCNGCDCTGNVRPWATRYHFDVDDVQEFAEFLEHCGGFVIW